MTTTPTEKPKRTRLPMTRLRAAAAIDRILEKIPLEDRRKVLAFCEVPHDGPQVVIPDATAT